MSNNQASIYLNNMLINQHVLEQCRLYQVDKFIGISSVNCYPFDAEAPYSEDNLWGDLPNSDVVGYGMSKRMMILQSQLIRNQFGLNAINLILEGVYGPGDVFSHKKSRVIPANIIKCADALYGNNSEIKVWGSGKQIRDFIYIDDAVNAIIYAIDNYDDELPLNIGSGNHICIKDLINLISKISGFSGKIIWDKNKPSGQEKRFLQVSRAHNLSFKCKMPLDEGLKITIDWYKKNISKN